MDIYLNWSDIKINERGRRLFSADIYSLNSGRIEEKYGALGFRRILPLFYRLII